MGDFLTLLANKSIESPLELGGLLSFWYDPSDAASVTLNAQAVTALNDKSGNALHLAQGTSANQPAISSTLNGRNIITNGSNDCLVKASVTSGSLAAAKEFSLVGLMKYNAPAHNATLFYYNGSGALLNFNTTFGDGNFYCDFRDGTNGRLNGAAPGGWADAWHSFIYTRRADNLARVHIDGVPVLSATLTNSDFATGVSATMSLGAVNNGTSGLVGNYAEVFGLRRALSNDEISKVRGYFRRKWGVG